MSKPLDPDLTALAGYESGRADARRAIRKKIDIELINVPYNEYTYGYHDALKMMLALLRPDGEK